MCRWFSVALDGASPQENGQFGFARHGESLQAAGGHPDTDVSGRWEGRTWAARRPCHECFNPTVGIAEDPATGTAAGPLAFLLEQRGIAPAGKPVAIEQGHALQRPSRIEVCVHDGRVEIAGRAIVVGEGSLLLPSP
ncbi:MAG: PhzF family phenazine biosynthesis protein [Carbonactinosporaceae bacterium]